jgi:hypothetical protein
MPGQTEIAVMPATTRGTMTGTGTMKEDRLCDRARPLPARMVFAGPPTLRNPGATIRIADPSGGDSITVLRPGGIEIITAGRMSNRHNGTTAIIIRPIRSAQWGQVMFSPLPYSSLVWP